MSAETPQEDFEISPERALALARMAEDQMDQMDQMEEMHEGNTTDEQYIPPTLLRITDVEAIQNTLEGYRAQVNMLVELFKRATEVALQHLQQQADSSEPLELEVEDDEPCESYIDEDGNEHSAEEAEEEMRGILEFARTMSDLSITPDQITSDLVIAIAMSMPNIYDQRVYTPQRVEELVDQTGTARHTDNEDTQKTLATWAKAEKEARKADSKAANLFHYLLRSAQSNSQ